MMFSVFPQSNVLSLIINTQSPKHNNILNPTIKCFMLDYKYTEPSTNRSSEFKGITFPGYIQMYTSVHSDVSWESYCIAHYFQKVKFSKTSHKQYALGN